MITLKNKIINNMIWFYFFLFFIFPNFVFAKLVTCDGPDCTLAQFIEMVKNVLRFLVEVGIAFSVVIFVWAGWLYLSSGGDESKIKQAHDMFSKMIMGLIFALGAYLIVELIITSLGGSIGA